MAHQNPDEAETAHPHAVKVEVEDVVANAQDATAQEHELKLLDAIRLYPKSIFWSIVMSTAIIMEGYDTKLIGTLFAQPVLQKQYGQLAKAPDSYQISAPWQIGLGNGSTCGQLIGLLLSGHLSERFGFRKTAITGLMLMSAVLFMTFFAPDLKVLLAGQILLGK